MDDLELERVAARRAAGRAWKPGGWATGGCELAEASPAGPTRRCHWAPPAGPLARR
uniref:hypothetical protein n=1 Tax=Fodinicola feengrottensis TaxID=435914 RepID=UPI0013D77A34|nr:hypothetical protein [Fodinicola feengrottensis]